MRVFLFSIVTFMLVGTLAQTQSFSCPFGTEAVCLDYGDKICSSRGKCVTSDAVCFDSFTCGFDGFVCKSSLSEVISEYEDLIEKYNKLVREYEDLRFDYNQKIVSKKSINDKFMEVVDALEIALSEREGLANCVSNATNLDEAKGCY
jgi:hypothetical protein